jgi:hypothetical protein
MHPLENLQKLADTLRQSGHESDADNIEQQIERIEWLMEIRD